MFSRKSGRLVTHPILSVFRICMQYLFFSWQPHKAYSASYINTQLSFSTVVSELLFILKFGSRRCCIIPEPRLIRSLGFSGFLPRLATTICNILKLHYLWTATTTRTLVVTRC